MRIIYYLVISLTLFSCISTDSQEDKPLVSDTTQNKKKYGNLKGDTDTAIKGGEEVYNETVKATFTIHAQSEESGSQGSGFFIESNGIGVTNFHVLENMEKAQIKMKGGSYYPIKKVLLVNREADFVVFKVESENTVFNYLRPSKETPKIASSVCVIGAPRGLDFTYTEGKVSALRGDYETDYGAVIQIDAAVSPGNSGGPVLNMKGEVIGIATFKRSGENLNFAVNIRKVFNEYETLQKTVQMIRNGEEEEVIRKKLKVSDYFIENAQKMKNYLPNE